MKIQLHGYGKMGQMVEKLALKKGYTIADQGDVCIDFSSAEGVIANLKNCVKQNIPVVIGTTGWEHHLEEAKEIAQDGCALYAPNFSLGIALLGKLIEQTAKALPCAEKAGLDLHHSQKKDAPSGTAKRLSSQFSIPFSSMRIGSAYGTHEVIFETDNDRITLKHEAKNREGFAAGALAVAEWIIDQKGWLTLDDYLHSTHHSI